MVNLLIGFFLDPHLLGGRVILRLLHVRREHFAGVVVFLLLLVL